MATDAATADRLTPPVSPRGRIDGLSERDSAWLAGLLASPQEAKPAPPTAAAGASSDALATPAPTRMSRTRPLSPLAVQDAELTECEPSTVVVTAEHRGEADGPYDRIGVVDVIDIKDLLQSTDDDEMDVCGSCHTEHAVYFSDEEVGTCSAARAMKAERRRFMDSQRQNEERMRGFLCPCAVLPFVPLGAFVAFVAPALLFCVLRSSTSFLLGMCSWVPF